MPRLIADEGARGQLNASAEQSPQQRVEDYLGRVAKYVPVEIIAAFLLLRSWVPAFGSQSGYPAGVEFALYGALVVLTPLYFLKAGGAVPRRGLQAGVATASFVFWSYGIGGPFFFKALAQVLDVRLEYQGLGGAVVVIWSLVAGTIDPRKRAKA